ncbi:MAG: type II secretion system protein [Planctomycetes bacterium]|nr:type II secretion system protein [Planctomycetota bacterium]
MLLKTRLIKGGTETMLFRKSKVGSGFTIVELLTVMSIIIVLLSLLVPGLNQVRRYAKDLKQRNQFHSIEVALDTYNAEWDHYPDSDVDTVDGFDICGATRLCDALIGEDLLGFDPTGSYDITTPPIDLSGRRKYLPTENANAEELGDIYGDTVSTELNNFDPCDFVLGDVYKRVRNRSTGGARKLGMPVLYYKADTGKTLHDITEEGNAENIYNYEDNDDLVQLGRPWIGDSSVADAAHAMSTTHGGDPKIFYVKTKNYNINFLLGKPLRSDSYILWSAGADGEYGTDDDILNTD